jgi:ribosome maturation factor RimP
MKAIEQITELLNQKFTEPEFQNFFLVSIETLPNDIIHIFLDKDDGLNLDECALLSRFVEQKIEENQWLGETYTLEVSSPGLSRPLLLHRQYRKNISRLLSIELKDTHIGVKGKLAEVKENSIVITYLERITLEGSKKKKDIEVQREILLENIKKALVIPSFK